MRRIVLALALLQPLAAAGEGADAPATLASAASLAAPETAPAATVSVPLPDAPGPVVIEPDADAAPASPVSVPFPDTAEAPFTGPGRPLERGLDIALPDPPALAVVPIPQDLAVVVPSPGEPPLPRIDAPAGTAIAAEALARQLDRLVAKARLQRADADAVAAFYAGREGRPVWTGASGWNGRAMRLRDALAAAGDDGLDARHYTTVAAFHGRPETLVPGLAAAELELTTAAVRYARDVRTGRIEPSRIHPLVTPRRDPPDVGALLEALALAPEPAAVLAREAPPHAGYRLLKARLADLRRNRPEPAAVTLPAGRVLRAGMRDPRVPLIRLAAGLGYSADDLYSPEIARSIATRQRQAGLQADGRFTDRTRRILSGEDEPAEIAEVLANMELWRHVPRDLGDDHILVNTPSYRMDVVSAGAPAFSTRVIVGKDETQTPFFSGEMDHIVVNPSWYVPPGILKRDKRYLDPAWTAARGYELRRKGQIVTVRVPPSASNALGAVKFMFPNSHAVYLHDTNARGLFNAANRALSNGCVRVENPMRLATHLFADQGWTEERFRRLVGQGERPMRLKEKLPVHLVYLTLAPGADGTLERHPDIYGHVRRLGQLLAGE